jgi:ABC-2 type transport system ATP-binding protein
MNEDGGGSRHRCPNLNKSFGTKHVVVDLSLRVERGEIFGFLGPNGSGKTTSIRLMCGLLIPDSGSGTCLGFDIIKQSEAIKRNVGYMTQRFSFWEDLTIRENLEFTARVYEMEDRRAVVDKALADRPREPRGPAHRNAGRVEAGWRRSPHACCIARSSALDDRPRAWIPTRREFWESCTIRRAGPGSRQHALHGRAERCHKLAYIAYGRLPVRARPAKRSMRRASRLSRCKDTT